MINYMYIFSSFQLVTVFKSKSTDISPASALGLFTVACPC